MPQSDPVAAIAILLTAALVGGMLAHRLKQPVVLGYLIIGVAVGPYALGLVGDVALVKAAATMGVALLMFTLGLEVSLSQLRQAGKVGLWGGMLQILATFALGLAVGSLLFRWSLPQAALFGLVISLSSTMLCLKILMDRGELDSVHGRIMIAILVLQDISVALMVVVEPLLGGALENLPLALAMAMVKATISVGVAVVLGLWVLPWLMGTVGGVRSRELFLLTVMVLCLGAALGTYFFGLSMVFGAFVIGLVLHESKFGHQALAEVTPLRDIFATLFFVSLGMLLNPRFILENWQLTTLTVTAVIIIKFLVVFGIVRLFRFVPRIAVLSGAGLFQIGEFGFILSQAAADTGVISEEFYSLILASAIITMILTPVSMSSASWLYTRLAPIPSGKTRETEELSALPVSGSSPDENLVIIAGHGRVGRNIAQGLQETGTPCAVIEIDAEVVAEIRKSGITVIYGDASNEHVLLGASIRKARVLVVTFPDPLAAVATIKAALSINPKLKVVARVHRLREAELLKNLGVVELVNPEYEASLEFLRRILALSGLKQTEQKEAIAMIEQDKEITEVILKDEG